MMITDEQNDEEEDEDCYESISLELASSLRRLRALTAPLQGCIVVCTIAVLAGPGGCTYRDFGRYGGKRGNHVLPCGHLQTKEERSGRKIKRRDQAVRSIVFGGLSYAGDRGY